jgi:hypothetical protein
MPLTCCLGRKFASKPTNRCARIAGYADSSSKARAAIPRAPAKAGTQGFKNIPSSPGLLFPQQQGEA